MLAFHIFFFVFGKLISLKSHELMVRTNRDERLHYETFHRSFFVSFLLCLAWLLHNFHPLFTLLSPLGFLIVFPVSFQCAWYGCLQCSRIAGMRSCVRAAKSLNSLRWNMQWKFLDLPQQQQAAANADDGRRHWATIKSCRRDDGPQRDVCENQNVFNHAKIFKC